VPTKDTLDKTDLFCPPPGRIKGALVYRPRVNIQKIKGSIAENQQITKLDGVFRGASALF
jgi:hypothetical protein